LIHPDQTFKKKKKKKEKEKRFDMMKVSLQGCIIFKNIL